MEAPWCKWCAMMVRPRLPDTALSHRQPSRCSCCRCCWGNSQRRCHHCCCCCLQRVYGRGVGRLLGRGCLLQYPMIPAVIRPDDRDILLLVLLVLLVLSGSLLKDRYVAASCKRFAGEDTKLSPAYLRRRSGTQVHGFRPSRCTEGFSLMRYHSH